MLGTSKGLKDAHDINDINILLEPALHHNHVYILHQTSVKLEGAPFPLADSYSLWMSLGDLCTI